MLISLIFLLIHTKLGLSQFAVYPGYNLYPSNSCVDRRPDCRVFENVCDHPDYKWYMDGCCKNTCDEECRRKDPNDRDWEARRRRYREQREFDNPIGSRRDQIDTQNPVAGRYRDTERDLERERRNNEAIRRKYLGEIDRNRLNAGGLGPGRVWDLPIGSRPGVYGSYPNPQTAYRISDLGKWRDDNRWDRNDPSLPSPI